MYYCYHLDIAYCWWLDLTSPAFTLTCIGTHLHICMYILCESTYTNLSLGQCKPERVPYREVECIIMAFVCHLHAANNCKCTLYLVHVCIFKCNIGRAIQIDRWWELGWVWITNKTKTRRMIHERLAICVRGQLLKNEWKPSCRENSPLFMSMHHHLITLWAHTGPQSRACISLVNILNYSCVIMYLIAMLYSRRLVMHRNHIPFKFPSNTDHIYSKQVRYFCRWQCSSIWSQRPQNHIVYFAWGYI